MAREAVVYLLKRPAGSIREARRRGKLVLEQKGLAAVAEFVEAEAAPGQQTWEALKAAVEQAKDRLLVIVAIGRLTWSPTFLRILSDSGVSFLCCDNPDLWEGNVAAQLARALNRAQHNSQTQRDRHGRRAAFTSKTRLSDKRFAAGVKLGGQNSAKARSLRATQVYEVLLPTIQAHRETGKTFDQVAAVLNEAGHLTTLGTPFNGPTVFRIMQRMQ